MSKPGLNLHSQARQLHEENETLRAELARLLAEAHDLWHIVRPNLIALYHTKIGAWELKLLQTMYHAAQLKRTIELSQAALNRNESPDWQGIEEQIQRELVHWQQQIAEAVERIKSAEARLRSLMSPAQDRQLKKLYHALVKALHPDLHPDLTEDQQRMWLRVQDAYDRGDFEELRALALVVKQPEAAVPELPSLDNLRLEQDKLRKHIAATLAGLASIRQTPPFPLQAQLQDEVWVAERRQEFETKRESYQAKAEALLALLKTLRTTDRHDPRFGTN